MKSTLGKLKLLILALAHNPINEPTLVSNASQPNWWVVALATLDADLKCVAFGQDTALQVSASAIQTNREELPFGKLVNGGEVSVHMKDSVLSFEISPVPPKMGKKGGKAKVKAED